MNAIDHLFIVEFEGGPNSSDRAALPLFESFKAQFETSIVEDSGVSIVDDYDQLPLMLVEVRTDDALARLRANSLIKQVHENSAFEMQDVQSNALIHQSAAIARGARGAITSVAVLDTGVNYFHSDLGSCGSPGGNCRVKVALDFAPQDYSVDANGHGSNVAAVIASVAPDAWLLSLDVFNGQYAYTSDIVSAINWVIANRASYRIAALNMSLGGGRYYAPCSQDAIEVAMASARSHGILSVVASGNNGWTDSLASPACGPNAISVGAVYDYASQTPFGSCGLPAIDKVTCFSNSAAFLTILAPGAFATGGGYTMAGTSQAAPHVAGAIAVLRSAFPEETAEETLARLLAGSPVVTDYRQGRQTPRADLGAATFGSCFIGVSAPASSAPSGGGTLEFSVTDFEGCGWTATSNSSHLHPSPASGSGNGTVQVTVDPNSGAARPAFVTISGHDVLINQRGDTTPPVGTVSIPAFTKTVQITVTMNASDPAGVARSCISNSTFCPDSTNGAANTTSRLFTLPARDGLKTIRVWFTDGLGNISASPIAATTRLDTAPPSLSSVRVVRLHGQNNIIWSSTDSGSGVANYSVYRSATPYPSCTGTPIYMGSLGEFGDRDVTTGQAYYYRICATDRAGNTNTGSTTGILTL